MTHSSEAAGFWIYLLQLRNGKLYTGYTNNLTRRLLDHNSGLGAKITRSFRPCTLACCWKLQAERGDALRIEAFIKRLQRKDKEALIADPQVLGTRLYEEFGRTFNIDPVLHR